MYDLNLKSDFSIDSRIPMEDMVLAAIDKNMKTICFADIIDLDFTINRLNLSFRIGDYFKNINKVKYSFLRNIEILAGLEIRMQPHLNKQYMEIIKGHPFDFILMSISSINGKDIFSSTLLDESDPSSALYLYCEHILECMNLYDDYDALDIFSIFDKYFVDSSITLSQGEYYSLLNEILSLLISKSKGLEINTLVLDPESSNFNSKLSILKLYKELGGDIVTIGSSSSTPQDIGYNYKLTEKLLRDLGFKYIYIFRSRKKIPIQIA